MALELQLRTLHPESEAAGRESETGPGTGFLNVKAHSQ